METKEVSEKQLAANRLNAQKSSGPRTAEGKRRSSRNSLKHGVLAQDLVIAVGDGKEDVSAFEELRDRFYEDLQPRDVLEEIAVNNILQCVWRERRCLRAEQGEVRKRVDRAAERLRQQNSDDAQGDYQPHAGPDPWRRLRRHSYGVEWCAQAVFWARSQAEERGHPTDDDLNELTRRFGADDQDIQDGIQRLTGLASKACQAARKEPGSDRAREAAALKQELLALLDEWLARLGERKRALEEREELEVQAEVASRALPSAEVLEKVSRYETSIARRREKAVETLLKLQARDLASDGPPEEEPAGESEA